MKKYVPTVLSSKDKNSPPTGYESYQVIDVYQELLKEKFLIDRPKNYFATPEQQQQAFEIFLQTNTLQSVWVAHPWSKKLYHLPNASEYFQLRTARNRNLLTLIEQEKLYDQKIAVAGLSVGSNIVLSLIRYGIGNNYRIADSDMIAVSNFNRTMYDLRNLSQPKSQIMLETINNLDPYIKTEIYAEGLTLKNMPQFVKGSDLIVDAFDNFSLKIALRKEAKKQRVPVVSGFDIEKGALIIVERYDLDSDLDLSLFLNGHSEAEIMKPAIKPDERTKLFIDIIGQELHSARMLDSVTNVGKNLTGYPQLIIATLLAASLFTATIGDILLQRVTGSYRKYVSVT